MLTAKRIPLGKVKSANESKGKGREKAMGLAQQTKEMVPVNLFKSFANFIHFLRTGKNLAKNVKLMPHYSVEMNREQAVAAYKRIKALRTVRGARFATKGELILAAVSEGAWMLVVTFGKLEEGRYLLSVEIRRR